MTHESTARKRHWEQTHAQKSPTAVSWYQTVPTTSLELIIRSSIPRSAPLIDVGGGVSTLVDHLLDSGYTKITVADISARALEATKKRLGARASAIRFLVGDVMTADLSGPYALWHDRAVFHFLTDDADRSAYIAQLERALAPGGHAIIATFADNGPERCSGLPVRRHSPDELVATFAGVLEPVTTLRHVHQTPSGAEQRFVFGLFRRPSGH